MSKRIFISVSGRFAKVIFKGEKSQLIVNMFPGSYIYNSPLSYNIKDKKWIEYDVLKRIILLPDSLKVLPNGVNVTENDYLVRHNTFDIKETFSHIKIGHTVLDDSVYMRVFDAILEGGSEDEIVNRIISKLWPGGDDWKARDEFLTRIYLGEKPEDILNGSHSFRGADYSAFMEEYIPFNEKSYTERINEYKKGADELYIALRDKMISSK
jgi:hypothetical protein